MKHLSAIIIGLITFANAASLQLPTAFSSQFTQTITSPTKKIIKYSGSVDYSSSSLLKWSYFTPTKKEVCTNGKVVLVVDHRLEQVSMFKISKGFNLPMVIKSAKSIGNNKFIAKYEKKQYNITTNSNGELKQIAYTDELDNGVVVNFNTTKYLKSPIDSNKLKCNYPSNYDIIEG